MPGIPISSEIWSALSSRYAAVPSLYCVSVRMCEMHHITSAESGTHELTPSDKFLIVATDGLWRVMTSEEAVVVVNRVCEGVLWGGTGVPGKQPTFAKATAVPGTTPARKERRLSFTKSPLETSRGRADSFCQEPSVTVEADPADAVKLVRQGAMLQPHQSIANRRVMPAVAHSATINHSTVMPGTECRIHVCAGSTPAAGCGGGSSVAMDLMESLIAADVRRSRLERRQKTAIAAAEALIAAARHRWQLLSHEASDPSTAILGQQRPNPSAPFDDISAIVVIFEM
jgi:hypothetical protein